MKVTARILTGVVCLAAISYVHGQEAVRDDWFKVAVEAFVEWTDNRDSVSERQAFGDDTGRFDYKKTDNVKYGIGPILSLRKDYRRAAVRGEYQPMFTWWSNPRIGKSEFELTHRAYGELSFNSGERTEWHIRDSFKYLDDPRIYMGSEEYPLDPNDKTIRRENSHFDNHLSGGFRHSLSRQLYTTADAFWRVKRYDDTLLADNGDEDAYGVLVSLMRQHSAYLSYGVTAGYESYDRENVYDLEMGVESLTVGVGAKYKVDKHVDLTARAGYEFVEHESDEIKDRNFPTDTLIQLDIIPTRRSRAVVGARYRVTEGHVYPYVSQERMTFFSSWNYRMTATLSSTLRFDYSQGKYEEKYTNRDTPDSAYYSKINIEKGKRDGDRDELYFYAGLNYKWSEKLTVTGYYSYEDVDSDVDESFKRNTVGVRAKYVF